MSLTILYIEDETAIIDLLKDVLRHPEIELLYEFSADAGLKKARLIKPDLIMLDVMMPGRGGWSAYEEIRSDSNLSKTPVIMLTGQLHRYRIMKLFSRSAIDAYITKPFNALDVRLEVEKMLRTPFWSSEKFARKEPRQADRISGPVVLIRKKPKRKPPAE